MATSLFVDVVGQGHPLVLMHGGPAADLWTMASFATIDEEDHLLLLRSPDPLGQLITDFARRRPLTV